MSTLLAVGNGKFKMNSSTGYTELYLYGVVCRTSTKVSYGVLETFDSESFVNLALLIVGMY